MARSYTQFSSPIIPPEPTRHDEATLAPHRHPIGSAPEVYDVEGGLVIPLYVLVFAFLGGAVNMTRKVPKVQKKVADLTLSYEVLARGLQAAMTFTTEKDGPPHHSEAAEHNEIRHQLILQWRAADRGVLQTQTVDRPSAPPSGAARRSGIGG